MLDQYGILFHKDFELKDKINELSKVENDIDKE
jgi:hypothetical protein